MHFHHSVKVLKWTQFFLQHNVPKFFVGVFHGESGVIQTGIHIHVIHMIHSTCQSVHFSMGCYPWQRVRYMYSFRQLKTTMMVLQIYNFMYLIFICMYNLYSVHVHVLHVNFVFLIVTNHDQIGTCEHELKSLVTVSYTHLTLPTICSV